MPHAFLLTGNNGIGKSNFAYALAARLLCLSPDERIACGKCKSCHLLKAKSHPDFFNIIPEAENKALKIDAIRLLSAKLSNTSQVNPFKVVLLRPADALNSNAANALLKNLEEPSANTVFILETSQPGQVMPTIRSRCNKILMPSASREQAMEWLKGHDALDENFNLLWGLYPGAPHAIINFNDPDTLAQRQMVYACLCMLSERRANIVDVAQQCAQIDQIILLNWLWSWVSDLIRLIMTGNEAQLRNTDVMPSMKKIASQLSIHELYSYIDKLNESRRLILAGHNPNQLLLIEDLLANWTKCGAAN